MTDLDILYEDNHIIVVVKPPNMPVQADETKAKDLLSELKAYVKEKYEKPGDVYLGLVHRLDRPVGGVMVYARTSKAASRLSQAIRDRQFHKTYLAVAEGLPDNADGRRIDWLLKDHKTNTVRVVKKGTPEALEAKLRYVTRRMAGKRSLIEVELETGRPHQIRVQLAAMGCPIVGDGKYGGGGRDEDAGIALWAWKLSFKHPTRDEMMNFEAEPPMESPWDQLVSYD